MGCCLLTHRCFPHRYCLGHATRKPSEVDINKWPVNQQTTSTNASHASHQYSPRSRSPRTQGWCKNVTLGHPPRALAALSLSKRSFSRNLSCCALSANYRGVRYFVVRSSDLSISIRPPVLSLLGTLVCLTTMSNTELQGTASYCSRDAFEEKPGLIYDS